MSATDSVSEVARLRARLEKEYEALTVLKGVRRYRVGLHEVVEVSEQCSSSPFPLKSLEKPPHLILSLRLRSI